MAANPDEIKRIALSCCWGAPVASASAVSLAVALARLASPVAFRRRRSTRPGG